MDNNDNDNGRPCISSRDSLPHQAEQHKCILSSSILPRRARCHRPQLQIHLHHHPGTARVHLLLGLRRHVHEESHSRCSSSSGYAGTRRVAPDPRPPPNARVAAATPPQPPSARGGGNRRSSSSVFTGGGMQLLGLRQRATLGPSSVSASSGTRLLGLHRCTVLGPSLAFAGTSARRLVAAGATRD